MCKLTFICFEKSSCCLHIEAVFLNIPTNSAQWLQLLSFSITCYFLSFGLFCYKTTKNTIKSGYSNSWEVISQFGCDLHFPDNSWHQSFFLFVGCLHTFLGKYLFMFFAWCVYFYYFMFIIFLKILLVWAHLGLKLYITVVHFTFLFLLMESMIKLI
jgi:hypothetical protein